ncbi:hypothetical protein AB838_19920 [Rhodobacteraceae bacterium (ex Bugula neritina AB1)]|nr:hypothetical protein AB838_19920 [Rhodobacteraceae bacterium (ex Bugula neritina AB1)]
MKSSAAVLGFSPQIRGAAFAWRAKCVTLFAAGASPRVGMRTPLMEWQLVQRHGHIANHMRQFSDQ